MSDQTLDRMHEALQSANFKIIGAPKEEGFPSVCLVQILKGTKLSTCTGTLVSPQLVLLAAHCLQGLVNASKVQCTFNLEDGTQKKVRSFYWLFPKAYSLEKIESGTFNSMLLGSSLDYAVLKLEDPILDIEPTPILSFQNFIAALNTKRVKSLKAVGFGRFSYDDEINEDEAHEKRSADFTKFKVFPNAQMLQIFPSLTTKSLLADKGEASVATAPGDSGGPYFANLMGKNFLVGMLSTVSTTVEGSQLPQTVYSIALSAERPYQAFKDQPKLKGLFGQTVSPLGLGFVGLGKVPTLVDSRRRLSPSGPIEIETRDPKAPPTLSQESVETSAAKTSGAVFVDTQTKVISASALSLGLILLVLSAIRSENT